MFQSTFAFKTIAEANIMAAWIIPFLSSLIYNWSDIHNKREKSASAQQTRTPKRSIHLCTQKWSVDHGEGENWSSSQPVGPFWQRKWRVKVVSRGLPGHAHSSWRDQLLSLWRETVVTVKAGGKRKGSTQIKINEGKNLLSAQGMQDDHPLERHETLKKGDWANYQGKPATYKGR